ncbi:MAG: Ig-like domain-containing protein [Roseburia sp.]
MKESLRKVFTEKKRIPAFLMALIMFATCFWQIDTQMFEAKAEGQEKIEFTVTAEKSPEEKYENDQVFGNILWLTNEEEEYTFSFNSEISNIEYQYQLSIDEECDEEKWEKIETVVKSDTVDTVDTVVNDKLVINKDSLLTSEEEYQYLWVRAISSDGTIDDSEEKSIHIIYDNTAPTITLGQAMSNGTSYNYGEWTQYDVTVSVGVSNLSAFKEGNSVKLSYRIGDSGNWENVGNTGDVVVSEAESGKKIYFKAESASGVTTTAESGVINIDSCVPEIAKTEDFAIRTKGDGYYENPTSCTLTLSNCNDSKSGCPITYYVYVSEETIDNISLDREGWEKIVDNNGIETNSYTVRDNKYYYFKAVSASGVACKEDAIITFSKDTIDSVEPIPKISVYKSASKEEITSETEEFLSGEWYNSFDLQFKIVNQAENSSNVSFEYETKSEKEWNDIAGTIEGKTSEGEVWTDLRTLLGDDSLTYFSDTITFKAESQARPTEKENYVSYSVNIDKTAPKDNGKIKIFSADGSNVELEENKNGWYNQAVKLVFENEQDGEAPIDVYYYICKSGETMPDKRKFNKWDPEKEVKIEGSGKYVVYYYRQDAAGNCLKEVENYELNIDTMTPQVTLNVTEKDAFGNVKAWYGTDACFKANVWENQISDIQDFYYEYCVLESGTEKWVRAKELNKNDDEFTVTSEIIEKLGNPQTVYNIRAVAISGAGVIGYSDIITIHQDSMDPEVPILNIEGTKVNGWYNGNDANENKNPVASIELTQDDGSPIIYTATLDGKEVEDVTSFEIPYGTHTITYTATDVAGHSTSDIKIVKVDNRNPEIEVYKETEPNVAGWYKDDVTYCVIDKGNQLSELEYSYQYSIDNGETWSEWKEFPENNNSITISETLLSGVGKNVTHYLVNFRAVSGAGRESIVDSFSIKEDKVIPKNVEIAVTGTEGDNDWYQSGIVIKAKDIAAIQDNGSDVTAYYLLSKDGSEAVETEWDGSSIKLEEEGYYSFTYYTRDEAGNQCDSISVDYYIDYTAPQAPSITLETVNGSAFAKVMHFLTFKQFFKEEVKVTITTDNDNLAGLESLTYWTTENGTDSEAVSVNSTEAVFTLPLGFKGTVSAYATDKAGNRTETMTSDGVVYENVSADITINPSIDNGTWQSRDVSFHVITQDTESGLRKVTYTLNGAVVYEKDFTTVENVDVTYMDQSDVTATAEAADANGYNLTVTVVDNAGNESSKTENIYIDKTAPVITLSGVTAGSYANKNQNLTVAVDETIFNYDTVTVTATRTLDGNTENYPVAGFNSTGVHSEQTYSFSDDGTYVVTVSAVDAAGNLAETKQITFSVDKTAPEITLNGVEEGSHNPSGVTAHLSVVESFYDTDSVTVSVTKTLDGNRTNYNAGTWQNTGKISEMSMDFGEDGTYLIEVNAQDAAGNNAVSQQLSFTVDMTAPEVSIGGADDYYISGNTISLTYAVTESYYETNNVTIDVTREDAAGNITDVPVGSFNSTAKESSLTYSFKEDGIYTSTLTAVDKAGNESTVKKTVTVDTTNPVIRYVDEIDGKYYQVFSLEHSIEEMVEDVTVPTYEMTLNGEEYDGVTEVTDEGKYVFAMDVSDEVGHTAYASAEFIVDNTAPTVIVTGAEDGMVSYDNVDLAVSLSDSDDIMEEVKVGGKEQKFDEESNTYTTRLTEVGTYDIEVAATDKAGNSTVQGIEITIANRSFIGKWFDNKPFFVGSIVCVGGAAGVGGYAAVLARRRRLK